MASTSLVRPQSARIIPASGTSFVPPNALYTRPPFTIRGIQEASSWWTAGQPILPLAPADTSPRGLQYLSQQNKIFTPRATEYLTFEDLRKLAAYPLASILINMHCDIVASRKWQIRLRQVPGQNNKQREEAEKKDDTITRLTDFFMNPNPDNTYREFVRMWVRECLVTDAPAIYVRRDRRRNIGELRVIDGCYSDDTEALTDSGWKLFKDIDINRERFATRNLETKKFEWQLASHYTESYYCGPMCNFHSRTMDLLVTPNHRMLIKPVRSKDRPSREHIEVAATLFGKRVLAIPATSKWRAPDIDRFTFPDAGSRDLDMRHGYCRCGCGRKTKIAKHTKSVNKWRKGSPVFYIKGHQAHLRAKASFSLSGDDFAAFMGAYLSEGSTAQDRQSHYRVAITQYPASKGYEAFRILLTRIFGKEPRRDGKSWLINHKSLHDYLNQFGKSFQKFIPNEIMGMSARQLAIFWRFYALGDGDAARDRITTTSPTIADQLQEIAQKMGYSAGISKPTRHDTKLPQGTVIKAEDCHQIFKVSLRSSTEQLVKLDRVPYSGKIFCVTVPNGVIYVRRGGHPAWCGNSMIARYIDDNGWTPSSESPAYAQLWWGTPAWNLTRDQLFYRPKNPKAYKLYGTPPTEDMERWLELGWARLELKLQWAQNGTIPDGLMIVPPQASIEMIERQQAWMNAVMTANPQKRVQLRLIQGFSQDGKDQVLFPKEKMLIDEYDDYEIRTLCSGYGVSKTRLLQQMNRSSSEQAQEAAEEEGTWPTEQYVMDCMNILVQSPLYLGLSRYEFTYQDQRDKDQAVQSAADKSYQSTGAKTLNEVRDGLGLDPIQDNPWADQPMVLTTNGPVPYQPALPAEPSPEGDEGAGGSKPAVKPTQVLPAPKTPKGKLAAVRRIIDAEFIEEENRRQVEQFIAGTRDDQRFGKVHVGMTIDPHHYSLHGEQSKKNLAHAMDKRFAGVVKEFVAKLKTAAAKKVRKGDDDYNEAEIKKLLGDDEFWTTLWIDLPDDVSPELEAAVRAGMSKGIMEANVSASSTDLINAFNATAHAYAQDRAAEMVGMKRVDGELVPNPKAQYVISDTTRDELRRIIAQSFEQNTKLSDLVKSIEDAGAFSTVRAQMIAATEVSRAQASGTWNVWEKTGVVQSYRWQNSNMPNVCDDCIDNAEAGEIAFGKTFPSGDLYPPAHPNAVLSGSTLAHYGRLEQLFGSRYDGPAITAELEPLKGATETINSHIEALGYLALGNVRSKESAKNGSILVAERNRLASSITPQGISLTIGPNHPVLTRRGFLTAELLDENDELLYDSWTQVAAIVTESNLEQVPSVEDVFKALNAISGYSTIAGPCTNFHGDEAFCYGEVQVVRPTRALLAELDAEGIEKLCECSLSGAYADAAHVTGCSACRLAFDRVFVAATRSMAGPHARFIVCRPRFVSRHWFHGMAFDATTSKSIYASQGIIVKNCRCVIVAVKTGNSKAAA